MLIIALLIVVIPLLFVLGTGVPFSSAISSALVGTSILLIIAAKALKVIKKTKEGKNIAWDIGTIIGLLIVLASMLLR